jgi:hypothetical protein
VAISVSLPTGLPSLMADPSQLQQVLINLVLNALDVTPSGGQISISARPLTTDERSGVAIAVTDTGPGIPAELRTKVFEPFFTTKAAGQGTGLGLAICRDLVVGLGGEIMLESGGGTTFTVWLPDTSHAR